MCPIFFYVKGGFFNEKDQNGKRNYEYNEKRGVQTTGIHRYRHTFAKRWILNGGNVVSLSKLLGHSTLEITQNYIHLLTSDVAKQVDEFNMLDKFYSKKRIAMGKA